MVQLGDYPEVFQTAFGDRPVRRPEAAGAHLRIYGQLEARLTQSDRVILGGLVEGVWPPAPRNDPWLSRPMRHQLGLDLPERRIGLSAHDFAQLLGADDVILSHAAKVGGAPSVASRFLHRLEAVAGETRWDAAKAAGEKYIHFANELDRPDKVEPIPQPMPKPPRAARPLKLSVTAIEDWLRDPYTIYAKHILKLEPLDPVDMPLSAADRGSAIHDALGDFTQIYKTTLPDDPAGALRRIGEKHFAPLMDRPEARALWWPRFLRIASWFAGWESRAAAQCQNDRCGNPGPRFQFPSTTGAHFISPRAPTASSIAPTAPLPFSITRPARRRPASRCAWGCRRSSRWKPRSCARAALRGLPRALRSASCCMSGSAATIRRANRSCWS